MSKQTKPNPSARAKDIRARIVVVDDHPLVRTAMASLINRQSDVTCCGGAENIPEARQLIASEKPDLAVVDITLGEEDGLELVKILSAERPKLRLLVLSQLDEAVYAERALRAGAHGYVMKEQAADELMTAIRKVLAGEIYVSRKIAALALRRMIEGKASTSAPNLTSLTQRELVVLKSVAAGLSNRHIAAELELSVKTVETYREHLKYKLGIASGKELVLYAEQWLKEQTTPSLRTDVPTRPHPQTPLGDARMS